MIYQEQKHFLNKRLDLNLVLSYIPLLLEKSDKTGGFFDNGDEEPINITLDNEYASEWIVHIKYMNIIEFIPDQRENKKIHY